MSKQLNIVLPEQIDETLEDITETTGLTKSEIGRRGLVSELQDLGGYDE